MRKTIRLPLAALALAAAASVQAGDAARSPVVRISFGVTKVDLTGKGNPAMTVLAHRENFNAHSFDVLSLYIGEPTGKGQPQWHIVPVQDKGKETFVVTAGGGADCLLHDFRLLAAARKSPARLVLADRELGESYANAAQVNFKFYELRKNTEGDPGTPLYYFELVRTQKAKQRYCDVGEAFAKELGLGGYGDAQ